MLYCDENDDPDEDPTEDDDSLRIRHPLDLGLALDGHHGDGSVEDEEDDTDTPQDAQDKGKQAWNVAMAERDEDGEWRTVGEPLPDAQFADLALAFETVDRLNRRDFGPKFDWTADPPKAWIAVRVGQAGALRVNRPASPPNLAGQV